MKKIHLAILVASLSISSQANAKCCSVVSISNMGTLVSAINSASGRIVASVTAASTSIVGAITNMNAQAHADIERQNIVNKGIAEAAQDHDKKYRFQENVAKVKQETQVSADACQVIATGDAIGEAQQEERETVKRVTGEFSKRNMNTTNQSAVIAQTVKLHKDMYCSEEDAKALGCTPAARELQNADIVATNLFEPNVNMAYTPEQSIAAKSYIQNLVNPFPTQTLPKNTLATVQGKSFYAAQLDEQRKLSVSENSLATIFASRESVPGLGRRAMMNVEDTSVAGVIKFYAEKFLDPNKQAEIAAANSPQMLMKELVTNMSFKVYLDYKNYQQIERQEALTASLFAMQSEERSKRSIEAQRARLKNVASN